MSLLCPPHPEEIIKKEPKNSDAIHYLGVIAHQTNNYEEAIKLISNAYESFSKQTGGNQEQEEEIYKQKYLKYKTKYLQYKIQLDNKVCHNCINSNQQTGGNYNQQTNITVNNLKMDKNLCNNCGNYL